MTEHDDPLARVIETLKEPVAIDPGLDSRVMAAIEEQPLASKSTLLDGWLSRRWTIRFSPAGGLAAAAVVATVILAASLLTRGRELPPPAGPSTQQTSGEVMQFVLVAPDAKSVALVGDFNDWSLSATRLARQPGDGVWWVTVSLPPGRYRYAFIVDGDSWRSDPNAPVVEDEFGGSNSVVTIGGA